MTHIMTADLSPTQTTYCDGTVAEYQWIESSEVDGATGWDSVEAFVCSCLDNVEIVESPPFSIRILPDDAVVVTPAEGEEGHMKCFCLYWLLNPCPLRDFREAAGLTQKYCATVMGKSLRYYQSLESGACPIGKVNLSAAINLAAAFNVKVDELL